MVFKQNEMFKGIGISALGAFGIYYAYNLPCNISTNPVVGMTADIAKIVCLTKDPQVTILLMVATAMVFSGVSKVIQNL